MELFTNFSSISEIPDSKNQDMILTGKLSSGNIWYLVADGHGKNVVIDNLRKLDYSTIMENEKPFDTICTKINALPNTFNSGSTLSLVIISNHKISCYWRGDSTIKIWEGKDQIFESANHDDTNEAEMLRLSKLGISTKDGWAPKILSPDTLTMIPKKYFILDIDQSSGKIDQMNMTNCIGHNNKSQGETSEYHFTMKPSVEYTTIVASDGLWDIVAPDDNLPEFNNATSLCDFALDRWYKVWNYEFPGSETVKQTLGGRDDICAALWKGGTMNND
tara:strand:- start:1001 stop:1828 length:828 start_codon:yes stop_codon:yes gene_type:complete